MVNLKARIWIIRFVSRGPPDSGAVGVPREAERRRATFESHTPHIAAAASSQRLLNKGGARARVCVSSSS